MSSALSSLFGTRSHFNQNDDADVDVSLCLSCAESLTNLYDAWKKFLNLVNRSGQVVAKFKLAKRRLKIFDTEEKNRNCKKRKHGEELILSDLNRDDEEVEVKVGVAIFFA